MANLSGIIKEDIEALIKKSMDLYSPNDITKTLACLDEAWDKLPEPKNNWQEGFLIAKYIIHSFFNVKNFNKAEQWLDKFISFNEIRDYGESEFMSAKVKYELGKEREALALFKVADAKSKGRVWAGEKEVKYFKFFKS
jgi:hypothetical protein